MRFFRHKWLKKRMDIAVAGFGRLLLTSVRPAFAGAGSEPVEGHRHYVIDFIQSDSTGRVGKAQRAHAVSRKLWRRMQGAFSVGTLCFARPAFYP
jgi:hypothetical protein